MSKNLRDKVHQYLIKRTDFLSAKDQVTERELVHFVNEAIDEIIDREDIFLDEHERIRIVRGMMETIVALGPLRILVDDPSISEIMVNGANTVYVQRDGKLELTNIKFDSTGQLLHTIQKMLSASGTSRRVDEASPYVDFSLSDGSRVNIILPPCSLVGPVVTIRKFALDITTVDDLIERYTLNKEMAMLLIRGIRAKLNIIFCGATGTGKTTMLNVLSRHIPEEERIVTIEDTAELRLRQRHVVSLQSRMANVEGKGIISIRELFVNSLRMRPDRIIMGEVRGEEAFDMIQSISSGHSGSLAIVHAESPGDCFDRMISLLLMSGVRLTVEEIRKQVAHAIDLIVHVELFMDGKRRVTSITDVRHQKEENKISLDNIFSFCQEKVDAKGNIIGHWVMNKKRPSFYHKFEKRNLEFPKGFFE